MAKTKQMNDTINKMQISKTIKEANKCEKVTSSNESK
jgi:hypothetical protein